MTVIGANAGLIMLMLTLISTYLVPMRQYRQPLYANSGRTMATLLSDLVGFGTMWRQLVVFHYSHASCYDSDSEGELQPAITEEVKDLAKLCQAKTEGPAAITL